ncbi:MAG: hypothetical protein P8L83_03925 [Flavobacteriaceae bacterium]|nr:hypothetical protein [Flavobacteriaceae bacterium]
MNRFGILIALIFLFLNSCQKTIKSSIKQDLKDSIIGFNFTPPDKLVSLSVQYRIRNNMFNWSEFSVFIDGFENLVTLNPEGNLVFVEELELKSKMLSKSKFPKQLDLPDIRSRLKVVQTMLMQCRYHSENKNWEELNLSLQSLYSSYNSFIRRIQSVNEEINLFSNDN